MAAADPKPAAVKPKKKAAASAQTAAAIHSTPKLVVPTQSPDSPLEEISDLLDLLPIQACVELTRRLLTSVSSLPTGSVRQRAVLQTVIVLWPNMAARPRRTRRRKPLRLTCWNADGVRGRKLELEHFLSQQGVDICLLSEAFLNSGQAFRLVNYICHRRQTNCRGRNSHHGPPWYCPPLSARSGPDPLGGYCHPSHTGLQTGVNPCGISFSFPPNDRSGPDRLFWWGITGLVGRGSQRHTRGLELAADHETGKTPPRLCRREFLSDLWSGHPNHQPLQLIRYSRCLGYRDNEERPIPGVSDFVLGTKLGQPPGTH
jgi:hypothetical protein